MSDIPWSEVSEERKEQARTEYARESGLGGFPSHMNDWDVRPHVDDPGGAFTPRESQESERDATDQQENGGGGLDPSGDKPTPSNREVIAAVVLLLALLGGGLGGN